MFIINLEAAIPSFLLSKCNFFGCDQRDTATTLCMNCVPTMVDYILLAILLQRTDL